MATQDLLEVVIAEVRRKYKFHTLILYGSHARGEAGPASDVDLLVVRNGGKPLRDVRYWRGTCLDITIHPEHKVTPRDFMHIHGGRVLEESGKQFGTKLLAAIKRQYSKGPPRMPADYRQLEIIWAQKMLDRAAQRNPEGNFSRAWLLSRLLTNYFALRQLWYDGPRGALRWLEENDPTTAALFARALKPNASLSIISKLVRAVNSGRPQSRKAT